MIIPLQNRKPAMINDMIRNSWTCKSWHEAEVSEAKENGVIYDARGASRPGKPVVQCNNAKCKPPEPLAYLCRSLNSEISASLIEYKTYYCCPRRLFVGRLYEGCTTFRCRLSASDRLNVLSSLQRGQWTFIFRGLWIVSSCLVRS